MPAMEVLITCLSPVLREAFQAQLKQIEDSVTRDLAGQLLEGLVECKNDEPFGVRFQEVAEGAAAAERGGKTKRKLSAYNLFVRDFLKEHSGASIGEAAKAWNAQKKARGQ